ncbi:MAG: ribokinase [Bacilli bacterium]|nr:ribokinase [Bacilli bacterium]
MKKKIVVVGAFVTDLVATMKEFPAAGESIVGETLNTYLGGKGVNQCVSVARLGGDVSMIGMVGDDAYGKKFLSFMDEEGIDHRGVFVHKELPTGLAQVQINASSQNRICVIPGANMGFGFEEEEKVKPILDNADIVMFQFEMRLDVIFDMIRYCHKKGKTVVLNPAPAAPIPDDILAAVDYLTPNETELAKISGISSYDTLEDIEEGCKRLKDKGVKTIVTTLGDRGCYIYNEKGNFYKGFKVKAVDTVAAGDSFNGAFTVKLSEGSSLEEAARYANGMGALTVQTKGAIPSLKNRECLEAFLAENK